VHPDYANRAKKKIVLLNPQRIEKLDNFDQRRTARLNRRHPWRAPLLATLEALSLSPTGKALALDLLSAQRKEKNVREANELLNGKREWQGKVHPADTGQIITPVTRFPRELKPELLIAGQPISICDISHAHHSFLPRLVEERIGYLRGSHAPSQKIEPYEAERDRLRHSLSEGDYYRMWCKNPEDDQERQQKKELLTMILNWRNSKAERNRLYRWMRATFPLTFGIIEDIKRDDHRRISRKLQNFTARVINAALLTVQDHGIPAIPDVDAILCPADHKEAVCNAIGEEIFGLAGVCAKIGGIRFAPEQFPPQKVCATCKQHGRITPVVTGLETCPECGFPPDICCPF
jgi:hypothetical protein